MNTTAISNDDHEILNQLDLIEREMKRIGFWSNNPPKFKATNYLEAPSFELWLQCIFLPNARHSAARSSYPMTSQVGTMAIRQYDYHEQVEKAQRLVELLTTFDQMINKRNI